MSQDTKTDDAKATGCQLPCPRCGEAQANITVGLSDLTADDTFQCMECEATFGVDDVKALLRAWPKILGWLDGFPAIDEAEAS